MLRAIRLIPANERRDAGSIDTVILTSDRRRAAKGDLTGVKGTRIALDLAETPLMRTDDALVLEDGSLVEIVAAAEPLYELRAPDLAALARLAWYLGDRHIPVQVLPNRLRVRQEPAVEKLLVEIGVKFVAIEAPFEPEGGAYAPSHDHGTHDHGHDHHHDHQPHRPK